MREINLIPYEMALQEEALRHLRLWVAAFAGIVLVIAAVFFIQNEIIDKINDEVVRLESRNKVLKNRYGQVKQLQQKRLELVKKENIVNALLSNNNFTKVFIELERCMTGSVKLTHISMAQKFYKIPDPEAEWVETGYFIVKKQNPAKSAKRGGNDSPDLILKGASLTHYDLAHFIDSLEKSAQFFNINLKQCREAKQGSSTIDFEIDAQLRK